MAEPGDSSSGVSADSRGTIPGRPRHGRLDDGLPHDLSSFIGRERELVQVLALIERARLVTLVGPGGSGKTRLAIDAARRAATAMRLEAVFVDLAPVRDPGLIASSIYRSGQRALFIVKNDAGAFKSVYGQGSGRDRPMPGGRPEGKTVHATE